MTNIGDMVPKAGIYTNPGVVVEKKRDGTIVVDTEPLEINKYHRYTNTTGLTEDEKKTFNNILDQIYVKENDVEKIEDIQKSIDRLQLDPKHSNVVQYLRNQQAHLVRQAKELPRTYTWDSSNVRGMR